MNQIMDNPQSTVFLVDDHPDVREAIDTALQARGHNVRSFASGSEFLREQMPNHAVCLILDLAMPGMSGLQVQAALLERGDSLPIIFLTGYGDVPSAAQALKRGAMDFLEKPVKPSELDELVIRALQTDQTAKATNERVRVIRRRAEALSKRQHEIFYLVVQGHPNKQIGKLLGIGEDTVKDHRKKVVQKMRAVSPADLMRMGKLIEFSVVIEQKRTRVPREERHRIVLTMEVDNRSEVLAPVTEAIANAESNISQISAETEGKHARVEVVVEVRDRRHLDKLLHIVRSITGVRRVERRMTCAGSDDSL